MENKFIEPKFELQVFTCPHCGVVAQMDWYTSTSVGNFFYEKASKVQSHCSHYESYANRIKEMQAMAIFYKQNAPDFVVCQACNVISVWLDEKMIYPKPKLTPPPNKDLSDDIKADYNEAADIVQDSPRGACALLRLALQKLMIELGDDKNLDKAIKNLIEKKAIDETLQKALDSVRAIGNNVVHPGQLDLKDDREIAVFLFEILNYIAEKILSDKKKIEKIYNKLPENAKRENRNKE